MIFGQGIIHKKVRRYLNRAVAGIDVLNAVKSLLYLAGGNGFADFVQGLLVGRLKTDIYVDQRRQMRQILEQLFRGLQERGDRAKEKNITAVRIRIAEIEFSIRFFYTASDKICPGE